ncbi:MAG: adenine deaminase [Chloroflexi bacterium]|nr:MAG: adenine deaminase [Chloroflexota bacterium]MBL1193460.1 adenine deaminase [Chloroflexota bacterium]NOH10751.1 adenine deaminase [Chloroflexota bacterium]
MGRAPADLVIRNGQWVSVQSGEVISKTDIAIVSGRIAYVGADASHTIGDHTQVIEANDRFLVPGLLDAHMHVESGMVTVTEFVRAVIPHGTTGMFIDPHEIANVFGLKGVKLMVDEAAEQPIHVWVQMPSCVPSAPGLETPGAHIGPAEVAEAMTWDGIIGLGEMMNFPGVFNGDENMLAEMAATAVAGKTIGGHYASLDLGLPFHGYVAGGPEDDHEGTRKEDAVARVRQGMKAMLRLGSAWYDVATQIKAVTEDGLDPRNFILCTDDSHSETLITEGHMDRVVRHAIDQGVSPMIALQMATINTAEHFNVSQDMGMLAPGRCGDVLLVSDLDKLVIDQVIAKGQTVAEGGDLLLDLPAYSYPDWASQSVKLGKELTADDFKLSADVDGAYRANVIGVVENQAPTKHLQMEVNVEKGEVSVDMGRDIAKIALVERHVATGGVQVGLVSGFGFDQPCGLATTVAHDSHHMIVVGTSESDMALAANKLAKVGGGQVVVKDGEVIGLVELPIAGLMSNERAEIVAEKAGTVLAGFEACGSTLNNPNMQMSLLALVVIPELRISDLGLVDVTKFDFVPVLEAK